MLSLQNYNNKKIGILGFGKSGMAAFNLLCKLNNELYVYDDHITKPKNIENAIWKHYKNWDWENLYRIIISPGIKIDGQKIHQCATLAKQNKIPMINEVSLFLEQKPKAKIIGITGTNGKSTLASLISHILTQNKIKNFIGGNYGIPASLLSDPGNKGVIILELSSYQLLTTPNLKLDFGTITNITPDHLDYHGTFNSYIEAKMQMIKSLKKKGKLIINNGDETLKTYLNPYKKNYHKNIFLIKSHNNFPKVKNLPGKHNKIISDIACNFCILLGLSENNIKKSLKNFNPLPHRMEIIFNSKNLLIINDSKATNGESAAAALSSFKNIFWIAGGLPKEDGIGKAVKNLKNIKHIWLIGKSRNLFEKQILSVTSKIPINKFKNLHDAINSIFKNKEILKKTKVTILFSPAAASFDQFKNFETRGNFFKNTILKHIKEKDLTC